VDDLLALASSPRGLGREPQTIEDFMDTWNQLSFVTELYGDRTAPLGTVVEAGRTLEVSTERLIPLAELVLSGDVASLNPTGSSRLLDRDGTEYTTYLSGPDGARSTVRRLVWGPYTLLREVTDDHDSGALLRVEATNLDEGVVHDTDLQA
jgi:2-polyprenyl-6-methoxyphenol hydroxylase-like FAD-dependent oxidoreductase